MVSKRLIISFLLVFILLHLSECCTTTYTHQDTKKTVSEDHGMIAIEPVFENGVSIAAEVEKSTLRGRKMMNEKSLGKEITKEEVSTISGRDTSALKTDSWISAPEQLKVEKRSNSEELFVLQQSDIDNSFQNVEPQKLADAANEIVKLMNTDYVRESIRHKPPIHNNEPLNQEHTLP